MAIEVMDLSTRCPSCGKKLVKEYHYDEYDVLLQTLTSCMSCLWCEIPQQDNMDGIIKKIKTKFKE